MSAATAARASASHPAATLRRFTCPYHAWAYNLDGSLFSARMLDGGHDRDALSLYPLRVEVLEGLIYVSLSRGSAGLFASCARVMEPCLAPFGLPHTRIAHRAIYPVKANWKLLLENYNECYHCAPAHPEFSRSHAIHHARQPRARRSTSAMQARSSRLWHAPPS